MPLRPSGAGSRITSAHNIIAAPARDLYLTPTPRPPRPHASRSASAMAESLIPKDRIPWRHLVLFGWLPSALKILAYRLLLGYRIGRGVRFGFGGIVVGESVEICDRVQICFLPVVHGRTT